MLVRSKNFQCPLTMWFWVACSGVILAEILCLHGVTLDQWVALLLHTFRIWCSKPTFVPTFYLCLCVCVWGGGGGACSPCGFPPAVHRQATQLICITKLPAVFVYIYMCIYAMDWHPTLCCLGLAPGLHVTLTRISGGKMDVSSKLCCY